MLKGFQLYSVRHHFLSLKMWLFIDLIRIYLKPFPLLIQNKIIGFTYSFNCKYIWLMFNF